ncbi:hypothetical protein [Paraburkholderia sp. BL21I4N1]|uniref:hypothetical protein n=1 Tax=Paraburkholderia sp. BL21I4N1 TaxID=1938801 RepID=UPI0011B1E272|nr:hypothetical protein [Paraburkholderia sp. BL21I4N1]
MPKWQNTEAPKRETGTAPFARSLRFCLKIAPVDALALRKTVQNDDFGAPRERAVRMRRKTA